MNVTPVSWKPLSEVTSGEGALSEARMPSLAFISSYKRAISTEKEPTPKGNRSQRNILRGVSKIAKNSWARGQKVKVLFFVSLLLNAFLKTTVLVVLRLFLKYRTE